MASDLRVDADALTRLRGVPGRFHQLLPLFCPAGETQIPVHDAVAGISLCWLVAALRLPEVADAALLRRLAGPVADLLRQGGDAPRVAVAITRRGYYANVGRTGWCSLTRWLEPPLDVLPAETVTASLVWLVRDTAGLLNPPPPPAFDEVLP
jgi:hypothetical protein